MQKKIERVVAGEDEKHWRVNLAVMSLSQFLSGLGFSFVFPFFPFYLRILGLKSESEVLLWMGYTSLAFGITMGISAPLWGLLADRYGRKLMVVRSMFAGALVLGLMGLATNAWHILILRFLQGVTTGTVTAAVTMVSSVTPARRLGVSLGVLQTSLILGNVLGPLAGGILADHFGYRIPCGLAFITLLIGAILVIFGAKERFAPPVGRRENGFRTMRGILNTGGFPAILAAYFFLYVLVTMVAPILPLFIEQLAKNPGNAATLTGTIIGVSGLFSGISAAWFGRFGDRFGHDRVLLFSLIVAGVLSLPQAAAQNVWVLFVERCLQGLAMGGIVPAVNVLVSNLIPREKVGSAFGLTSSVTCLGIGAGPFLGGSMAAAIGLRWPFVIMGVLSFLIAIGVYRTVSGIAGARKPADGTERILSTAGSGT
jgi:MFS transporter, DHA1 family, multidrug resistance protein